MHDIFSTVLYMTEKTFTHVFATTFSSYFIQFPPILFSWSWGIPVFIVLQILDMSFLCVSTSYLLLSQINKKFLCLWVKLKTHEPYFGIFLMGKKKSNLERLFLPLFIKAFMYDDSNWITLFFFFVMNHYFFIYLKLYLVYSFFFF